MALLEAGVGRLHYTSYTMKRLIIPLLLILVFVAYITCRSIKGIPATAVILQGKDGNPRNLNDDLGLDTPRPSRESRLRSILESNNAPIQFHGIVVDEKSNALSEVEVVWSVMKSGAFATAIGMPTGARGTVQTDLSGRFSITETGTSVNIESLRKPGYHEAQRTMRSFGYGNTNPEPHQPDRSRPQQFLLIKDGAASVLKREMNLAFDWDGTPKEFEIGTKDIKETLILIPSRGPERSGVRGFDWKLVLKSKNGQVIAAKMGDAPLAPESGYGEEIVVKDDAGPKWMANADALFYLRSATGKYAELRINAYPMRGSEDGLTAGLSIRWNSTGGRSFE
jgi:hypothetical protein